jgi:hypothetical protein
MQNVRLSALLAAAAICALTTLSAQAQTGVLYTYNGTTNGLTLTGNAATAHTSDGTVLRLTPASIGQSGAVYYTTPLPLGNGATFSTQFQFRITNAGGLDPADGFVFVLTTNTTGLGQGGYAIGYGGVAGNSVGIEFDTFENGGDDTSSNHIAIDTDGNVTDTALVNVYGIANCVFGTYQQPGCLSNGDLWTVNISYNGSALTVTLTDPAEGSSFTALNNYPINLSSILGQNTAYAGFSAGSGSGWENHDIVSWTFANTPQITQSAPALSGFGLGFLAILLALSVFVMFHRGRAEGPPHRRVS